MAGTKKGGLAAAASNKAKYGNNFYRIIGAKGGSLSRTGGFHQNRELARQAGAIGGRISRRTKAGRKPHKLSAEQQYERLLEQFKKGELNYHQFMAATANL